MFDIKSVDCGVKNSFCACSFDMILNFGGKMWKIMFEPEKFTLEKNTFTIKINRDAIFEGIKSFANSDSKIHSDENGVYVDIQAMIKLDFQNEELSILF